MPFPTGINKEVQWKPGQSGNPKGKAKGTRHISTVIQKLMDDPDFTLKLRDGTIFKGNIMEAIIRTAQAQAFSGDKSARDWLAKYGYGMTIRHAGEDGGPLQTVVIYRPEKLLDDNKE